MFSRPYKVGTGQCFPVTCYQGQEKNFSPYFAGPRMDFIPFILSLRKCERTDLISFILKRNTNPIYKTLAGI